MEKAKGELTGIIGEITSQMTDIFGQQFKLLSESFEQTFVELFGGGQAKLELEDPEHILDCGIEIKAQPPGKPSRPSPCSLAARRLLWPLRYISPF